MTEKNKFQQFLDEYDFLLKVRKIFTTKTIDIISLNRVFALHGNYLQYNSSKSRLADDIDEEEFNLLKEYFNGK